MTSLPKSNVPADVVRKGEGYFRDAYQALTAQVDHVFAWLLAVEWLGLIALAAILSPFTWNGAGRSVHPHFWAAVLAGPAFILPVIALALLWPSSRITRHAIAVAQMLISSLLIDVTGGRIESHFHIFGSLAFLTFYRDWRVLVTASVLTALDHAFRGWWWPGLVYGVTMVSPWRWAEHTWWVVFEDFFLIQAAKRSVREMWAVAMSQAWLYAGAYHDALTGLPNRRLLEETFDAGKAAEPNAMRALLFIDLDRFKEANDTLGHAAGDRLLVSVTQRFAEVAGSESTLSRFGGDEFVLLMEADSPTRDSLEQEALRMGSRLLNSLAEPFDFDGHTLLLSASIGISMAPEHGDDLATLQQMADLAMYAAKAQGRNQCIVFSNEMAGREDILKAVRRDLFLAIERGQMSVHFQPLVDQKGETIWFETLARWTHPVYGPVPPSDFIPLAENSGFIVRLGEWVLREACRNCRDWQPYANRPLGVTVNASPVQLEDPGFPETVAGILREFDLDPGLLTIELTETALVRELARTEKQLSALRGTGVTVALDDFGTGYSSLSYLTGLPADFIKLDRYFATRECNNSRIVLESVIDLAHRVGLKVIGEGIKTSAQKDNLSGLQCDFFQGYLFSRPMPGAQVRDFLEDRYADLHNLSEAISDCAEPVGASLVPVAV